MGRRLLVLGPPGSGKGTQAVRLAAGVGVPHISTGDMLRAAVAAGTDLGREAKQHMDAGTLVPDEVVIGMLLERVAEDDACCGYLLDGFPRTVPQAEVLEGRMGDAGPELALALDVDDDEVVRRISGRRSCPAGHVFHVVFNPPAVESICDECGAPLAQRDDDREDVVRKRLAVYREQTAPLIDFYGARGMLRRVDGRGAVREVTIDLLEALLP